MKTKTAIAIFAVIIAVVAIAIILSIQTPQAHQTFNVSFRLTEANQTLRSLPIQFDTWQIRVYQNNPTTLRNVDLWINGEVVRHYDYLTARDGIMEDSTVLSGKGVSVSIYWEGGHESFHSP
jgi:ABC-type antimicrobial peptide transport system permease subunit